MAYKPVPPWCIMHKYTSNYPKENIKNKEHEHIERLEESNVPLAGPSQQTETTAKRSLTATQKTTQERPQTTNQITMAGTSESQ